MAAAGPAVSAEAGGGSDRAAGGSQAVVGTVVAVVGTLFDFDDGKSLVPLPR